MFVSQFEDVDYAAKTLHELYGNTLKGLVKGGGIRLSYSKNPLGVRTPTSANSNGATFQQQQQNGYFQTGGSASVSQVEDFRRRDMAVPPSAHYISSPPPRFITSSPSPFGTSSSSTPLSGTSSAFLPRSSLNMYGYSLQSAAPSMSSSFSPFGISPHAMIPDQHPSDQQLHHEQLSHHSFMPRSMSPPQHTNIEVARAG